MKKHPPEEAAEKVNGRLIPPPKADLSPFLIHRLDILPNWGFTRSVLDGTTTFNYHSSEGCPGYALEISHWRLRFTPTSSSEGGFTVNPEAQTPATVQGSLRDALKSLPELSCTTGGLGPNRGNAPPVAAPKEDAPIAPWPGTQYYDNAAFVHLPLMILRQLAGVLVDLERAPWPPGVRPAHLIHLARSGFASRSKLGMVVFAEGCRDAWIVSEFSECTVELSTKARIAEFPDIGKFDKLCADVHEIRRNTTPLPDAIKQVGQDVQAVHRDFESAAKRNYELREENEELHRLVEDKFAKLVSSVDILDFRYFAAIMLHGDRTKAARALKVPGGTLHDKVATWPSRGYFYRQMHAIMLSRKRAAQHFRVRTPAEPSNPDVHPDPERLEGFAALLARLGDVNLSREGCLDIMQRIFEVLKATNPDHMEAYYTELESTFREVAPQ